MPGIQARGISSRCMDGKHVVFLDYDNAAIRIVMDELAVLQDVHGIAPFYLFSTRDHGHTGNWHAISLTKLSMREAFEVIKDSSCDQAFKTMLGRNPYRDWTLRAFPKYRGMERLCGAPAFKGIVGGMSGLGRQVSRGHLLYLQARHALVDIRYQALDNFTDIWEVDYVSGK